MGIKKNQENKKLEIRNLDKKTFRRIDEKFRQYWKYLFWLISIYIASYFFWNFVIVKYGQKFTQGHDLNGNVMSFVIIMAVIQGLLFSLDGFVTALLKTPFNQMCYAINKAEGIPDKKKDYIITKATESNEHCKETLKKFGIITIAGQLLTFIAVSNSKENKLGIYGDLMVISYLVPILFAAIDIYLIHKELIKIKKNINSTHGGK